ncbi:hypothetical protein PQR39_25940 [Paraburkholderia sediminicola]|uniref:DUF7940 domain-containing protein n=1 Tax=Paraburkholderia sediminicola TaxID=458836 RepID=UPI0038B9AFE1
MTLRLVDDWKKVWTYSSSRLAALGAAAAAAGPALDAWNVVPDTLKSMLPSTLSTAMPLIIIFCAIFAARHVTTQPAATTQADANVDSSAK